MNPVTTFAERLRITMFLRKVKLIELSRMTGISKGQISKYMSGIVEPRQDKIDLIAHALDVEYAWLLGYDVPMSRLHKESDYHQELRDKIKEIILDASDEQLEKILDYAQLVTK